MALQSWVQTLESGIVSGATFSATTTETILIPDYVVPANYMYQGATLRMTVRGELSTSSATAGTLTFFTRWGGVSGTVMAQSAAITLATSQTNNTWEVEIIYTCQSIGTTGSIIAVGSVQLGASSSTNVINFMPATAPVVTTSLNTTTSNNLSVSAKFSANTSGLSITATQYVLESLY